MANLELKTTFHRGKNRIGIYFKQDLSIQEIIRKDFGAKWNRTFSYWCVDHHISDLKKLKMIFDSYHIIDQLQFTGKSPEDSIITSNQEIRAIDSHRTETISSDVTNVNNQEELTLIYSDINAERLQQEYHKDLSE